MDRIRAYEVFVSVVSHKGFARAAKALDTSPANVSRYINELEAHLGTRLLNRSSRNLSLTEAGEAQYSRGRAILDAIAEAEAVASRSSKPRGRLRLNAPVSFGVRYLAPLWPAFMEKYPSVELDVVLSDEATDLVTEGFDMAVRVTRAGSESYVARKLATSYDVVCASPAYLRRCGSPRTPDDLGRHVCIGYTHAPVADEWRFTDDSGNVQAVKIKSAIQTNSCDMARAAALAGVGIIWQPMFMVGEDVKEGRLVALLLGYHLPAVEVRAVYPSRRHLTAKVRAMVDFLVDAFASDRPWSFQPVGTGPSTTRRRPLAPQDEELAREV